MTHSLSRRQFLAAAAALAACGKRALAAGNPKAPPPFARRAPAGETPGLAGETKLFLPATRGGADRLKFANSPEWARNTPGWYIPNCLSAGSCMLQFSVESKYQLPSLVKSFRDLPALLIQARSLGTEAIYLVDWYEGGWENKGDYIPRSDLGGEAALRDGLAAVHAQGGRVIFYVEGFIINKQSAVGKQHGAEWSILHPNGPPEFQYPGYWKMCPAAEGWVTYLESVARRLGHYGADGLFLDSQGWRVEIWKCVARAHRHRLGDPEVFNNGCVDLARRVRAALRSANPEAIILTEGPTLERQFEFKDGSLDAGLHSLVTGSLWDAQGRTDTITTSFSFDDWNQIVAIGAKLACPGQFLDPPPSASAQAVLDEVLKRNLPDDHEKLHAIAHQAIWRLHQWRNSGLVLGLRMPGLDVLVPRPRQAAAHIHGPVVDPYRDGNTLRRTLEGWRPGAAAIDAAFAGKPAPAPAAYLKTLLTARQSLARFIDFGASVAPVKSGSPHAATWRFTGANGMALTAVNVADEPVRVTFPDARGTWRDGVKGDVFTAQGGTLNVAVPVHGVRLLQAG